MKHKSLFYESRFTHHSKFTHKSVYSCVRDKLLGNAYKNKKTRRKKNYSCLFSEILKLHT